MPGAGLPLGLHTSVGSSGMIRVKSRFIGPDFGKPNNSLRPVNLAVKTAPMKVLRDSYEWKSCLRNGASNRCSKLALAAELWTMTCLTS